LPRAGPKKIQRYSLEFKRKAVKLSEMEGVEVQAVADALEIHPFMLSRWRKEARDGVLRGLASVATMRAPPRREIKRLQQLERAHALLLEEHALLKKAIRFCSERKRMSSPSSKRSERPSR
jgi:transposase